MNEAFFLVSSHASGLRPSLVTAALARAVALKQNPAGDWSALRERPPSNHSRFTFTALGLRALQLYGHSRQKTDLEARVARAKAWLESHAARDTEDRTYQLLGLAWAGAERSLLARLSQELTETQQDDGGWNSIAGRGSDAYRPGRHWSRCTRPVRWPRRIPSGGGASSSCSARRQQTARGMSGRACRPGSARPTTRAAIHTDAISSFRWPLPVGA